MSMKPTMIASMTWGAEWRSAILGRRSFEAVTGPKIDYWLVRTVGGLLVAVGAVIVNAIVNTALIFGVPGIGLPALGLAGAGIGSSITVSFEFLALAFIISRDRRLSRYHLFGRFWRPDWPLFRRLVIIGAPIAVRDRVVGDRIGLAQVGFDGRGRQLDDAERIVERRHEDAPHDVDHRHRFTRARLADPRAASRHARREVRGPQSSGDR